MQLNAEMGSTMTERFNVAGAMLVKLFGRPREESDASSPTGRPRSATSASSHAMYGQVFFVSLTLLASLVTALVYGLGGTLVIRGTFQIGTLVALTHLLGRVYGPIASLSSVQINVMTALVSFDRVFEVLDLKPLIAEKPDAVRLPRTADANGQGALAPEIEFDRRVVPLPVGERGVARLAGVDRAARARTPGRRGGGPARGELPRAVGQADRPGRSLRSGQDHDHGAGGAAL